MRRESDIVLSHSQNFIKSNELTERLIREAGITKEDSVVEIGPGKGKITRILSKYAGTVLAVEKDSELYQYSLRNNEFENVKFFNEDFISFNLPWDREYKIFSNIPFNQTADIMRKILDNKRPPVSAHLIIQKEAAERYIGSERSSQTSVYYSAFFSFKIAYTFNPHDFTPVPKVTPVLLEIVPQDASFDRALFKAFVVYGFSQWRKDIGKALEKIFTYKQLKKLAVDNRFKLTAKPSDLTSTQWINMFKYFLVGVTPEKKAMIRGRA